MNTQPQASQIRGLTTAIRLAVLAYLQQGTNITLTGAIDGSGNLVVAAPGGGASGEANTASNLGTQNSTRRGLFSAKVGTDLRFLSIVPGSNMSIDSTTDPTSLILNAAPGATTVPDGNKGGVTVSGSGATWTINNSVVTNAMHADMPTANFKGRLTAGTGAPEDLTAAQVKSILAIANTDVSGLGTMSTQAASAVAITGGTVAGLTGFGVRNIGTGAFDFQQFYNGTLTAGRALTWNLNDAARTINLGGNIALGGTLTTAGAVTFAGAFGFTGTVTGTTTVTFPVTGTLATLAGVETLTNKRVAERVGSTTSSATPSIDSDSYDIYRITALAANITSVTVTGTPTHGQPLLIEITGTATRTLAFGSSFEASTVAVPTTTSGTSMLTVACTWNSATSKWRVIGVA